MSTTLPYVHPAPFSDHTYKTVGNLNLKLRIWPSLTANAEDPKPWFLWCHGGAWVSGDYCNPGGWKMKAIHQQEGYHIVSLSHRFAPQVGMEDIASDLVDAYEWCKANLELVVGKGTIVMERYAVGGESAGAANSLISGFLYDPPPKAIHSSYGPTDFTRPSPPLPSSPAPISGRFPVSQLIALMRSREEKDVISFCPWWISSTTSKETIERVTGLSGFVWGDREAMQIDAKIILKNLRSMTSTLFQEPIEDDGTPLAANLEMIEKRKKFSPCWMLEGRTSYPPTYFLHGDQDADVDVRESIDFKEKLDQMGVQCEMNLVEGGWHGVDYLWHEDSQRMQNDVPKIIAFIKKHVEA